MNREGEAAASAIIRCKSLRSRCPSQPVPGASRPSKPLRGACESEKYTGSESECEILREPLLTFALLTFHGGEAARRGEVEVDETGALGAPESQGGSGRRDQFLNRSPTSVDLGLITLGCPEHYRGLPPITTEVLFLSADCKPAVEKQDGKMTSGALPPTPTNFIRLWCNSSPPDC